MQLLIDILVIAAIERPKIVDVLPWDARVLRHIGLNRQTLGRDLLLQLSEVFEIIAQAKIPRLAEYCIEASLK